MLQTPADPTSPIHSKPVAAIVQTRPNSTELIQFNGVDAIVRPNTSWGTEAIRHDHQLLESRRNSVHVFPKNTWLMRESTRPGAVEGIVRQSRGD